MCGSDYNASLPPLVRSNPTAQRIGACLCALAFAMCAVPCAGNCGLGARHKVPNSMQRLARTPTWCMYTTANNRATSPHHAVPCPRPVSSGAVEHGAHTLTLCGPLCQQLRHATLRRVGPYAFPKTLTCACACPLVARCGRTRGRGTTSSSCTATARRLSATTAPSWPSAQRQVTSYQLHAPYYHRPFELDMSAMLCQPCLQRTGRGATTDAPRL